MPYTLHISSPDGSATAHVGLRDDVSAYFMDTPTISSKDPRTQDVLFAVWALFQELNGA